MPAQRLVRLTIQTGSGQSLHLPVEVDFLLLLVCLLRLVLARVDSIRALRVVVGDGLIDQLTARRLRTNTLSEVLGLFAGIVGRMITDRLPVMMLLLLLVAVVVVFHQRAVEVEIQNGAQRSLVVVLDYQRLSTGHSFGSGKQRRRARRRRGGR